MHKKILYFLDINKNSIHLINESRLIAKNIKIRTIDKRHYVQESLINKVT